LLDYSARYGGGVSLDSPPAPSDLQVPENERPAFAKVAGDLKLAALSERQKIRAVSSFFREGFVYSLDVPARSPMSPLARFLLQTHAGHCEYFATATVLLLRQAGVNARYVTGYAVPESARHGETYLVRGRHAHAWAQAYHSDTGIWEQIDNTPSSWDMAEGARPPWWEPVSDLFSNLYFHFSVWRWSETSYTRYAVWLMAPLILALVWRILTTKRRQRLGQSNAAAAVEPVWPGRDSELFLIHERLSGSQLSRQPNEPLAEWQARLEQASPDSNAIRRVFELHRRLRFDPRGLEDGDRAVLKREAEAWLAEFATATERAESRETALKIGH
jgi:protein-glutamine gamma-glutamyltransferase